MRIHGIELCPADACAIDDAFCPTDGSTKFQLCHESAAAVTAADVAVRIVFSRTRGIHIGWMTFIAMVD